jgi:hypothetical protein
MSTPGLDSFLLALFREHHVRTLTQLRAACSGSHMRFWRALSRLGYLTSYNHNGTFYTLADIPRFDRHGLWIFHDARFCRDRTLADALLRLVQESACGLSATDLEEMLGVRVNNHLRVLLRQGKLLRHKTGRQYCYLPTPETPPARSVGSPFLICPQVWTPPL